MALTAPPPEVARAGLRALVSVASVDGVLHELERDLLQSVQRLLLHTDFDLATLEPIAAAELSAAVPQPEFRERIAHGCIMMALIDGEAAPDELARVDELAAALGVRDASLKAMHRFADGQLRLLRFDLMRRFIVADRLGRVWNQKGLRGIWELAKVAIKGGDKALAARYRALEQLPPGTLGREYFEFIVRNEFSFPGEPGSPPEIMVFHDCNHVLADYGTSPEEETQVAAFHAGYRGHDKFGMMLFLLMQFHLGVQITPATGGLSGVVKPHLVFAAFERGAQVNRDLIADWDPQDDFERPVTDLRRELNIPPRA